MTSAKVLVHRSVTKIEARRILAQVKPVVRSAWKSMQNHRSAKGEVFHVIEVNRDWDGRVLNAEEVIVELEFRDRGVEFEKDLVKALGISLHGRWGRQIRIKFKREASLV